MSLFGWSTMSLSWSTSLKAVMVRLLLVYMPGHPLHSSDGAHCPPSVGSCSKIVARNLATTAGRQPPVRPVAVHNAAVSLHNAARSTDAERSIGLITTSVAPASR